MIAGFLNWLIEAHLRSPLSKTQDHFNWISLELWGKPFVSQSEAEEYYGDLLLDRYVHCLTQQPHNFKKTAKCFACAKKGQTKDRPD